MLAGERRKCGQGILSFAKYLSSTQTTTTAHHDERAPLLPTKETVVPCQIHNRGLGVSGGPLLAPSSSPEHKWWHGFVVTCQNRVVWYPPGAVYGLYYSLNALPWTERGLVGQKYPERKLTGKTVSKHMPKPVPWFFLTCPCTLRQESQALSLEHLDRTRQDQVICDLEWRVCWLKRAIPPSAEFFPSWNSVFCVFSAELSFMPLHHGICCHGAPRNLPQDRQLEGATQSDSPDFSCMMAAP